ncbi:MAG: beta strand repeat-containing protein [Marmoricola sp.]
MASLQTKPRSALAVLAGALLVLTGFSAPAEAATARAVSLHVSPTLQYAGSAVTFSGNVSKSGANRVVKIQRKSGASWVAAGSTTTKNSVGAYSVKLNLPSTAATYSYRALAPATGSYRGAYSGAVSVTALRHTAVTIAATPTTIGTGGAASLHGTVSPFVSGGTVLIQKLAGSTWETDASTTIGSNGSYAASVSPSATTTYRAAVSRTGVNAGAQSSPTTVTVTQASPPTITTTSLPQGDKGVSYTATLTKAGGDGTWSISVGQLPAGLTLAPATGVISGTPSAGGTVNFTARFTETATGLSATKALSIVVTPPPAITTTSLPDATQGIAYSFTLTKTGNPGTWSIAGLPTGLSINPVTGEISGTTNAAAGLYGVYPVFTETGTGRTVLKAFGLTVQAGDVTPPGGPSITTTSLPQADKGVPYTTTLAKTGGAGTWSIITGSLPVGLSLAPATGVISGTPSAGGTTSFTVKFTETSSGQAATKGLSIVVTPPPTITTTSLPAAIQNTPYSATLAKTGQAGTWSITGLPSGLSINPATGEISGSTTAAVGDYGVFPVFTETASGRTAAASLALHVSAGDTAPGGPSITTTALPDGDKGVAYTTTLEKSGGAGTWSVSVGNLPAGLSLAGATGVISGTPTAAGTVSFTVKFTETSSAKTATKSLSITVTPLPTITTDTLPDATRGTPYTATLTHTGHPGTWTLAKNQLGSDNLPDGLTFDGATGTISGTVTGPTGTYGIYPVFTETSTGRQALKALALTVVGQDVAITTTSLPDGTTGTAYSQQLAKTGGAGTFSVKTGSLPAGVSLSSSGLLSGTPSVSGDFGFTATFTETSSGVSDNQPLLLHVSAVGAPVITTSALPDGTVGDPYSATLAATGGGPNGHWYVSYGFLPAGVTLDGATGHLSGTPTTAGDSVFIVTYDTDTTDNTKVLSIHVDPAPAPPAG